MAARTMSPNLALNQLVAERQAAGEQIVHLAFGEARLPVLPEMAQQLALGASENAYGPVAGGPAVREAAAGYFTRRGLPTDPDQVVLAPGSKALLLALQLVYPGDVLLPRPAWNSYAPQARYAGKQVFGVPIPAECGGVPDPAALRETVARARAAGHDPRILILTLPDNPTGTLATPELVRQLAAYAQEEDLLIVSDEIYRDLLHDPATPYLSPAEVAPERTVVTNGLSKSFGLGGWRSGVARFPANELGERLRTDVVTFASESWSALAAPMQVATAFALSEPPVIRQRLAASARLHGAVARAVYEVFVDAGADCRPPTGGFYVYPDFEPMRDVLAQHGITDSDTLQRHLFAEFGVAVLAGHLLGDDPGALRFKAATSLLYGHSRAEQQAALDSADPVRLPHLAQVLGVLAESFGKLCGSRR
ncbi:pyridoxal phosphate-dependent aminotransferase [Catellatospora tritici]|uniref:pyridoxal phosphate-dependent aminotransferase n=1 Tax=Catellatospora tritici TaxID=2851566 RepID=UPI001C2DE001|nr:pyridoxal phosphate-dependent aminotransferase [Catellatospora tritici]MBV1855120.1 pyridoxal phosphate-dependent aminotransferase [Catellatospora tritici]